MNVKHPGFCHYTPVFGRYVCLDSIAIKPCRAERTGRAIGADASIRIITWVIIRNLTPSHSLIGTAMG